MYELTKTSLTTPEACARLARSLNVKSGSVEYAGLKDKHAVTTQAVSVAHAAFNGREPLGGAGDERWAARLTGFAEEPARAAWIQRNEFTIVVRGLGREDGREMERRAGLLGDADGLLVANYFGDQRFGSARHGEGFAARALVRGDFEGALKLLIGTPARKDSGGRRTLTRLCAAHWGDWRAVLKEMPANPERGAIEVLGEGGSFKGAFAALPSLVQSLAVEAYQSHLWNATVRRMIERGIEKRQILRADDDFGLMLFSHAGGVPRPWRSLELPMLAPGSRLDGEWGRAAREVLEEEGIGVESLRVPGLRRPAFGESWRPMFVRAEGFEMGPGERDEFAGERSPKRWKCGLRFSLPRGAYATVVLRALGQ